MDEWFVRHRDSGMLPLGNIMISRDMWVLPRDSGSATAAARTS